MKKKMATFRLTLNSPPHLTACCLTAATRSSSLALAPMDVVFSGYPSQAFPGEAYGLWWQS